MPSISAAFTCTPFARSSACATPAAPWHNPALPRATLQLLSVERYWLSREAVRRGVDRTRSPWLYVNAAVIDALDWNEIASTLLR